MGKQPPSYRNLVMIFLSTTLVWACGSEKAPVTQLTDTTVVNIEQVQHTNSQGSFYVSGTLEAQKTALLNFLVPGKVYKVNVDEGDHIRQGQVLALVESEDYVSQLNIAEAAFLLAQDAHDRFGPLVEEGAFAEADFIKIKSGLAQADAARDIANKRLRDTKLRAPISGIVGMKNVEVGQVVSPQVAAFTVVKTDTIFARVAVPESEVGSIKVGSSAMITISALEDLKVEGKVVLIGAMADPQTRTYTVKVELDNPGFRLWPGMIAKARISTNSQLQALTVPPHAIVRDAQNLSYVFTINTSSNRAERQRVIPGLVLQNAIEITTGLEPGDLVVIGGHHKLYDGAQVTIKDL